MTILGSRDLSCQFLYRRLLLSPRSLTLHGSGQAKAPCGDAVVVCCRYVLPLQREGGDGFDVGIVAADLVGAENPEGGSVVEAEFGDGVAGLAG